MLQTALGYFNAGSGVSAATIGMIDAVGDVLKVSPQLGAALGILTVGLGFLKKDPSPQDILDKAMSSVKLLSDEVNTMMDGMIDYVDAKDLQLERIVMDNHYNEIFDRWVNCAKELTAERANTCQQRAQNKISSARFHFQPFDELFDKVNTNENRPLYTPHFSYRASAGTWQWMKQHCGYDKHTRSECLSHEQVKRLEIGIIPFRDYASLHLLVLKTLQATYKGKSNTDRLACGYYKRYLSTIARKADYYIRYAKWAYEWTYIRQYEENDFFGVRGRAGGRPAGAFRGGFLGTRKCSGGKCTMQCTQMYKDNTCTGSGGDASRAVFKACENYIGSTKKQLMAFWQENVLKIVATWEKYKVDAKAKLKQVT
ncbi:hypothetical protein QZH41_019785, partial [Actinostola sp. cb2023]